jgi:hypothetical protein
VSTGGGADREQQGRLVARVMAPEGGGSGGRLGARATVPRGSGGGGDGGRLGAREVAPWGGGDGGDGGVQEFSACRRFKMR